MNQIVHPFSHRQPGKATTFLVIDPEDFDVVSLTPAEYIAIVHIAMKQSRAVSEADLLANQADRMFDGIVVQEIDRKARDVDEEDVVECVREAVSRNHDLQAHDVVLLRPGGVFKTSSGKVQRRACREAYLAGTLKRRSG